MVGINVGGYDGFAATAAGAPIKDLTKSTEQGSRFFTENQVHIFRKIDFFVKVWSQNDASYFLDRLAIL